MKPPPPFSREDVYPWRFTRSLSYMRRPLLELKKKEGKYLCWGTRHVFAAMEYIVDLCLSGRLQAQAKSKEMQDLMGKIHREDGEVFTQHIASLFEGFSSLIVKTNVKKIGKLRIGAPGNDLGDIDVLVVWPRKFRIFAIECKDLAIARTPKEMANELQELFRGNEKRVAVVTKHQRRCKWIKSHIKDLLETMRMPTRDRWKVEPILVVNEEMLTPYLYSPPFRIFSLERFKREFFAAFGENDV